MDGAFVLHFRRSADGTVTTQHENHLIDESGAWELLRSAVAASRRFADEWLPRLPDDDAGAEDLLLSLDKANRLLDSRLTGRGRHPEMGCRPVQPWTTGDSPTPPVGRCAMPEPEAEAESSRRAVLDVLHAAYAPLRVDEVAACLRARGKAADEDRLRALTAQDSGPQEGPRCCPGLRLPDLAADDGVLTRSDWPARLRLTGVPLDAARDAWTLRVLCDELLIAEESDVEPEALAPLRHRVAALAETVLGADAPEDDEALREEADDRHAELAPAAQAVRDGAAERLAALPETDRLFGVGAADGR